MTNSTQKTTASILFWAVVFLHFTGILFLDDLRFFTKPFLMIALVMLYVVFVKKINYWVVGAIFFSFWGDVFLLDKTQYFVYGLASFLVAHILYIKIVATFITKIDFKKIMLASMPFVVFFVIFFLFLKDNLAEMLLPVIAYGIVISVFGAIAFLNYLQHKNKANLVLFLGAVLFIISDSIIAINKFYEAQEIYQFCIMATYIAAQFLICKSLIAIANKEG